MSRETASSTPAARAVAEGALRALVAIKEIVGA
jgi:hypothetical protein